jgi:hypothetical protein
MLYPESASQGQMRAHAFRSQLEKDGWKIGGNLRIDFQRAPGGPFSEKELIVLRARDAGKCDQTTGHYCAKHGPERGACASRRR